MLTKRNLIIAGIALLWADRFAPSIAASLPIDGKTAATALLAYAAFK